MNRAGHLAEAEAMMKLVSNAALSVSMRYGVACVQRIIAAAQAAGV